MRCLSLITLAITTLPYYVYSFCVYNQHTDGTAFFISEVDGYGSTSNKAFKKDRIRAGEKQCCNYSNKDCVIGQNANAIVRFYVHRFSGDNKSLDTFEITCPGGGALTLGGTGANPTTAVKWADGSDFPYAKNMDAKRIWAAKVNETRTLNDQKQNPDHGGSQNKTEGAL
ncbi:hypothetical protein BJV82DRAFT_573768 [Fennellomyces sp. T-0311]|nr:hypothetical protein BJV82DRAFT_573768 [Fennellomyces sp. T-0311]